MAISKEIEYAATRDLFCDPLNPRLGRQHMDPDTPQEQLLEWMADWTLDELALSYLENQGFWTHEALLVAREDLYGESRLVVIEGNRRLAALKYLENAYDGHPASRKWKDITDSCSPPPDLFSKVPYLLVDTREDVQAFLGFRHVTGIKQWEADEKAGFIAKLIEQQQLSYDQVRRKIGSKTPTVRQHYIAYRLLCQMEDHVEEFDPRFAENRFALLYMTLRTEGARSYLNIDITADPAAAREPVPADHFKNLSRFAGWLFGSEKKDRFVTDTRQVDSFGKILESREAVEYLETSDAPRFDVAFRIAGGDEQEIIRNVNTASHNLEVALTRAHAFKSSDGLQKAVKRLGADAFQLLSIFPNILDDVRQEYK